MKYFKTFFAAMVLLASLVSCSIQQDVTYHADGAQSLLLDVDMRDLMASVPAGEKKSMGKTMDNLPTTWTPLKDMLKDKKPTWDKELTPEQKAVLNKMMIKANRDGKQTVGFSYKLDRITPEEDALLQSAREKNGKTNLGGIGVGDSTWKWDGSVLRINTSSFNAESLTKLLDIAADEAGKKVDSEDADAESMKQMMTLLLKNYTIRLHFEKPIQEVKGNHPWIKKLDDHTVQVVMDMNPENAFDKTKYSPSIEVVTK